MTVTNLKTADIHPYYTIKFTPHMVRNDIKTYPSDQRYAGKAIVSYSRRSEVMRQAISWKIILTKILSRHRRHRVGLRLLSFRVAITIFSRRDCYLIATRKDSHRKAIKKHSRNHSFSCHIRPCSRWVFKIVSSARQK